MITYNVKKTGSFLSKLSKDNRKRYSDIARKVAVKRQIKDKQKKNRPPIFYLFLAGLCSEQDLHSGQTVFHQEAGHGAVSAT
jgi:hypothetical protein